VSARGPSAALVLAAALATAASSSGCFEPPRLSLAAQLRIEADTRMTDVPEGRAQADDFGVRVISDHGLCSGAVIDPSLVLTAQHCVTREGGEHARPLDAGDVRVELGGDYLPWGRVGVSDIVRCPGWEGAAPRDVAVLVLERALPMDVPVAAPRLDGPPLDDERIDLYVFGGRDVMKEIPDTGWVALTTTRKHLPASRIEVGPDAVLIRHLTIPGDSGGPVIARDTREVIGVVSHGKEGDASGTPSGDPLALAARVDTCRGTIERARAIAWTR
jgi:hypothetical protein